MYKFLNNNERGVSLLNSILLIVSICGIMYIANYTTKPNQEQVGLNENKTNIIDTKNNYNVDNNYITSNNHNANNNYSIENNYNLVTNTPSSNITNTTNQYQSYFYNQLSNNAKIIYNSVINNIDILKKGQGKIEISITEERYR